MSKITNDGLTRSGTECFIAVPIWQQWASKRLKNSVCCTSVSSQHKLSLQTSVNSSVDFAAVASVQLDAGN